MTPTEVKELLKTLIVEACLPIDVVDMAPVRRSGKSSDHTTESRIKDVIHQWNTDGRIYTRAPGRAEIMEFYTKTDSVSPTKELLESLEVEILLESIITEQKLPIRFTDYGFRLITLAEDDTTRYPVKILHGGFRLEKKDGTKIKPSQLQGVANHFEALLKENRLKAKMLHRGFRLQRYSETEMLISQVREIVKQINAALGVNYVLNSYSYPHSDAAASETAWTSATIRVSLWRFPAKGTKI